MWERRQCESEWVDLVVVRHHGSVHRDDMVVRVCVSERRQCESECDDLVVVRHHGSVSGSTSSLRAVSG